METVTFLVVSLPVLVLLVMEISAGRRDKAARLRRQAEEEERWQRRENAANRVL